MTDQEMRIAIAEACGWAVFHCSVSPAGSFGTSSSRIWHLVCGKVIKSAFPWNDFSGKIKSPTLKDCAADLPDYLNDLNAMHEAESKLTDDCTESSQPRRYLSHLADIHFFENKGLRASEFGMIHSTARQRAEAFLRTIGKWTDK